MSQHSEGQIQRCCGQHWNVAEGWKMSVLKFCSDGTKEFTAMTKSDNESLRKAVYHTVYHTNKHINKQPKWHCRKFTSTLNLAVRRKITWHNSSSLHYLEEFDRRRRRRTDNRNDVRDSIAGIYDCPRQRPFARLLWSPRSSQRKHSLIVKKRNGKTA